MNKLQQIKQEMESRLIFLTKQRDYEKAGINDRIHHDHYAGSLERLEGTFGEIPFLEKMLLYIGEENDVTGNS